MIRILPIFALLALVLALGGCETKPAGDGFVYAPPPGYYVPTTLMLQTADARSQINPYQVLPTSDAEDYFVGRAEKFVYGSSSLYEYSSYSIMTYDSQRISGPGDSGYRYTWGSRVGVVSP